MVVGELHYNSIIDRLDQSIRENLDLSKLIYLPTSSKYANIAQIVDQIFFSDTGNLYKKYYSCWVLRHHWVNCINLPHPMLNEHLSVRARRQGRGLWNSVFWTWYGWWIHPLSIAVVACTWSKQKSFKHGWGRSSWNTTQTEMLLAVVGCWGRWMLGHPCTKWWSHSHTHTTNTSWTQWAIWNYNNHRRHEFKNKMGWWVLERIGRKQEEVDEIKYVAYIFETFKG